MNNIKSERARMQLSQEGLAKRLDVDSRTISNWETEKTPIPSKVAIEMSNIFGCSTDYLFGLVDERCATGAAA